MDMLGDLRPSINSGKLSLGERGTMKKTRSTKVGVLDLKDTATWRNLKLSEVLRKCDRHVISKSRMKSWRVIGDLEVFAH
jgi:hypothetical protein